MLRIPVKPREDLVRITQDYGFDFHIIDNEIYWDESHAYCFTLAQIESGIEDPTEELHQMCLEVVNSAINDERILEALAIPELYWDAIANSWRNNKSSLYGRMDFSWNGYQPAKLLEYNADTPTSLYESAFFQWQWLSDMTDRGMLPANADQFNSIQEKLIQRFLLWRNEHPFYFCCCEGSIEDRGTVLYLEDCARQAGLQTQFIYVEDIGLGLGGVFTDLQDQIIHQGFKLYPYEWMFQDDYGPVLRSERTEWVEPLWKSILSNKGLLPLLWRFFPNHPNLLPAYFADEQSDIVGKLKQDMGKAWQGFTTKPLFSREGANVSLFFNNEQEVITQELGMYAHEPRIYQASAFLPKFGNDYTLIGSWVVGDAPAGIGIREDNSLITNATSRFVPHYIMNE
ncbi:glutathionylspermidine synthase family protein [Providencia stuartii]|uniref:glutathionylspermidine synthase family protein n=1 Tax=Providencia stuartii TaxID=588 RepID=UPI002FDB614B